MKETEGWVKIKKYTDDEGKPVCNLKCKMIEFDASIKLSCIFSQKKAPGPSCPVWHSEGKGEWQPIETAPRDGSHIQLYRPEIQFVGYYGGAESGWRINAPGLPAIWPKPTHWKPLPAPPQEK